MRQMVFIDYSLHAMDVTVTAHSRGSILLSASVHLGAQIGAGVSCIGPP